MIDDEADGVSMAPIPRGWHIITELDLAQLIAEHRRLANLCDRMEACADALPAGARTMERANLSTALREILSRHADGDAPRIAALFAHEASGPLASVVLGHLRVRHCANAVCAEDLIAALSPQAHLSADTLGYMLRGFFDGCRAAIAFADLAILTLGEARLTRGARAVLIGDLDHGIAR